MLRAGDLALQTTNDCRDAIAVRNQDTSPTSVVPYTKFLETLSETIDRPPRRATDAGPTLLRNRDNGEDRKKTIRVSRG